jgi:hypothetical protein
MIRRDIRGRGIDAREAVTQDKECLARLHVGVKLQAGGPRGFHLPHAQFIFVAINLPLPTKVPGCIGVRQEWGKAFERASNPRVLLRRGVNWPSAGGGVRMTPTRTTLTGRWLHSDLCVPLGLLPDRRRRGRGGAPAALSRCDLRAGHPLMGQLFESLITAGGYRPRLPATSPRVMLTVQAASGENGIPPRLVFFGAESDPAGGGRAASGRGIILPAVICCIVVPLVIEREPLPRVRPETEGATRGWAASPGAATSSATTPTPSIEDTSHYFYCDGWYRRPSRRTRRPTSMMLYPATR